MTTPTPAADTVPLLRAAAADIRLHLADGPRLVAVDWSALADWFNMAAQREEDSAEQCVAIGTSLSAPEPGDEVHAAATLARAWMEAG